MEQVDIYKAKDLIEGSNAYIVDIRDPESFEESHIQGALLLNDQNVEEFVRKADKNRPLLCYCYHGNSSQNAAHYFQDAGFKNAYSMQGGFEAWRSVFPVESPS